VRATITTTTTKLLTGPTVTGRPGADTDARSFVLLAPAGGTVLLKPAAATAAPGDVDMSDACRYPFGSLALDYTLEPGRALFAKTETGTVSLDVLEGGER
jgi:hypothetical protein